MESRARIVVQSGHSVNSCEPSLAQDVEEYTSAEIALVWNQLKAEIVLTQHIQGVLNLEADAWADGARLKISQDAVISSKRVSHV